MLTSELKKLKKYLEGQNVTIDKNKLLDELNSLDEIAVEKVYESLSVSSKVCSTCGRPL